MLIHSSEATPFEIPGKTKGLLYPPSPRGDQSLAVVEMDGVYPEKGHSINDTCTETMYMLEGSFALECDGVSYTLAPGDVFMVLPRKPYRITGKGKSCVLISPSWDSAQNHIIE